MWSLQGSAASASSSWPTSRWRLESTLYHRRLLPPLCRLCFHTPQPVTGQRGRAPGMGAHNGKHPPLSQRVADSTSNSYVQALSVFMRILPSLPAATQQNTYFDVRWRGMRRCLCVSNTTSPEVDNSRRCRGVPANCLPPDCEGQLSVWWFVLCVGQWESGVIHTTLSIIH